MKNNYKRKTKFALTYKGDLDARGRKKFDISCYFKILCIVMVALIYRC